MQSGQSLIEFALTTTIAISVLLAILQLSLLVVQQYSAAPSTGGTGWCASRIADTSLPHACPGPNWSGISPTPSVVDGLLKDISSSSGTCDHYFPIKKTEDLPQRFRVMAGSIARGRLQ